MPGQHDVYTELSSTPPDTGGAGLAIIPGVARRQRGFVFIPGLVQNLAGQWLRMMMKVHLLDAAGRELAVRSTLGEAGQRVAPHAVLPPGGANGFMYLRDEEEIAGQVARYWLVVTDVKWAYSAGLVQVTGKLTSKAGDPCTSAGVALVAYTTDGRIFRAEIANVLDAQGNTLTDLDIGQAAGFDYLLDDENAVIVKVEAYPACGLPH